MTGNDRDDEGCCIGSRMKKGSCGCGCGTRSALKEKKGEDGPAEE
ncbi:hypothetical protein [Methanoculleus sp.]|nr:hypothetical protein [Methanoculleus sp.]